MLIGHPVGVTRRTSALRANEGAVQQQWCRRERRRQWKGRRSGDTRLVRQGLQGRVHVVCVYALSSLSDALDAPQHDHCEAQHRDRLKLFFVQRVSCTCVSFAIMDRGIVSEMYWMVG